MIEVTATVIGGGIVGCAVAAHLSEQGIQTVLLEKEGAVARGITSRNSEVAHGGMYYPTGTLKARCCVEGRRLLKEFCASRGVAYQECGKLIVAVTADEIGELERLLSLGEANGVEDLRWVEGDELHRLEPEIRAAAALYSPRTGILDAEGAAKAYAEVAKQHGAQIMTSSGATGLRPGPDGWEVDVASSGTGQRESWTHRSRVVINAAGLFADRVARLSGVDIDARDWRLVLSKGNYFRIDPRHTGRVNHLVYPVPPSDGSTLGTHVCLDLAGQLRLGPDFEPLTGEANGDTLLDETWDYRVDPARASEFHRDVGSFLPWLELEDLSPDQCGIRPKLTTSGMRDFVLHREEGDLTGMIHLVGIDSPGLTSAPALAIEVGRLAGEILE